MPNTKPTDTTPIRNAFRGIEEYSSLKEFELDIKAFKAQWYAHRRRAPRVGRPAEQADRVQVVAAINALMRDRRPDTHDPLLSQGQLRKLVTRCLQQEKVTVKPDNKTVRDACKMLRLVRGGKTMRDYTLLEWAWLLKHSRRTDREKARTIVASIIEHSTAKLKELTRLKVRSPREKKLLAAVQKWENSYYTTRLARYERLLTLFPPRP